MPQHTRQEQVRRSRATGPFRSPGPVATQAQAQAQVQPEPPPQSGVARPARSGPQGTLQAGPRRKKALSGPGRRKKQNRRRVLQSRLGHAPQLLR